MLVTLLVGPTAAAQTVPPAVLRIESPTPTHDASNVSRVSVVVAGADVREVLMVVNQVAQRVPVRDGRAVAPMQWIAGNNRVFVEARSHGRVVRDAVTVFRQPPEVARFDVNVTRLDGGDASDLRAKVTCQGGLDCPPGSGVFAVNLERRHYDQRPCNDDGREALRGDARGRPARIEAQVRVEVRLPAGAEREQRWVFVTRPRGCGGWREVGTFEVTPAMVAP